MWLTQKSITASNTRGMKIFRGPIGGEFEGGGLFL